MAIDYYCICGAHIWVPDSAAGKRARCKTCGVKFTVPAPEPETPLEELAMAEPVYDESAKAVARELLGEDDDMQAELADRESSQAVEDEGYQSPEETPSWMVVPTGAFWRDLGQSFVFFLDAGNLVTWLSFTVVLFLLNIMASFISFLPFVGAILGLFAGGYLCAFYLNVILETASGEDELSSVWIDSIADVVRSLGQFIGAWALVLLPAMILALVTWFQGYDIPWAIVIGLAVVGVFFWPVMVLGVAIGGGFNGLWPHVVIRTALAAPLPYLAIWGVLLVAAGLKVLPHTGLLQSLLSTYIPKITLHLDFVFIALSVYATIVAMRAIGLFYRHYKERFPWSAE